MERPLIQIQPAAVLGTRDGRAHSMLTISSRSACSPACLSPSAKMPRSMQLLATASQLAAATNLRCQAHLHASSVMHSCNRTAACATYPLRKSSACWAVRPWAATALFHASSVYFQRIPRAIPCRRARWRATAVENCSGRVRLRREARCFMIPFAVCVTIGRTSLPSQCPAAEAAAAERS